MIENNLLLMIFCFFICLAVIQSIADDNAQECVVAVAKVHPEWKPEELNTACR